MMARSPPPERPSSPALLVVVVRLSRNTGNLFLKLAVASRRGKLQSAPPPPPSLPPALPPPTRAFPSTQHSATMRHTTLAYLVISYLKHCTRIARARAHNWSCVAKTLECREPPLRGAPVLLPIDGLRRVDVDEGRGGEDYLDVFFIRTDWKSIGDRNWTRIEQRSRDLYVEEIG